MDHLIEKMLQVNVHHPGFASPDIPRRGFHSVMCTEPGSEEPVTEG
jgi:hypothetical protein